MRQVDSFTVRTWAELPLAKWLDLCCCLITSDKCPELSLKDLILDRGQQGLCTDNCNKTEKECANKDKGKKYLPSRWVYKLKFYTTWGKLRSNKMKIKKESWHDFRMLKEIKKGITFLWEKTMKLWNKTSRNEMKMGILKKKVRNPRNEN